MKMLFFILSFFITFDLFSQQQIQKCEEEDMNYMYSTTSSLPGIISWEFNNQIYYGNSLTIDWSVYDIGTYTITAQQDVNNCPSNIVFYTVEILECPTSTMWAPNAFTPDGGNLNEVWMPIGYNYYKEHFFIANRWGEIIFESYDLNNGWDGTYMGNPCQQDVYVYVLEWYSIDKRYFRKYGHITLLR